MGHGTQRYRDTYGSQYSEARKAAAFGPGAGSILLSDVYCKRVDVHLRDCKHSCWGLGGCSHQNDASVKCKVDIRLVDGSGPHEGRVEVYYNGVWGTVCDNGWGPEEAAAVCRGLGFVPDLATVRKGAHFGQGSSSMPVWLDDVDCSGSEDSITDCRIGGFGLSSCSHSNDVSVVCQAIGYRLVGRSDPREGRVELLVNNQWGTVCDNGWDKYEATIVCNKIGYPTTRAEAYGGAFFGEGSGPIWLDNLNCQYRYTPIHASSLYTVSHTTLSTCQHTGWGQTTCKHNGDVSVSCHPSVRLARGSKPNEGRVEFYQSNRWGTICDDGWGPEEASVVCWELGFKRSGAIAKKGAYFGEGTGSIHLSNVVCTGQESSIYGKCTYSRAYGCTHKQDASVICLTESNLDVLPIVNITTELMTGDEEPRKMYRFFCDFDGVDETVFYSSAWYVDDTLVYTSAVIRGSLDLESFKNRLSLTEDKLNRTVGYDIRCEIFASRNETSHQTVSKSESNFIGIKVLNPILKIREGETGQIRIRATAEIGCAILIPGVLCEYAVTVLIPNSVSKCGASLGVNDKCGVDILKQGWDNEYIINVATDTIKEYGQSLTQFEVILRSSVTEYGHHKTWGGYTIHPRVQVIVVKDTLPTQSLLCKAYSDPRLQTFKGLLLNLQYLGTYTLYKDDGNDIEVQIQTVSCGGAAFCNCGVIARVGGTAYMISKCNSQNWIIEYVMCDGGVDVLKVERNGDYKITFPTGATMTAHLHRGNPPRYVDVYVNPSFLDPNKVLGLCGKISNDKTQQLVLRNGTVTADTINYNNRSYQEAELFTSSWRVTPDESLFNPTVRDNFRPNIKTPVICECNPTDTRSPHQTIECNTKSNIKSCAKDNRYKEVSKRSCATHTFSRKRRSVPLFLPETGPIKRLKRQATWNNNWSEENATLYCNSLFDSDSLFKLCSKEIESLQQEIPIALETCKDDIKLTSATEFAMSAVGSVRSQCRHEVDLDPKLQEEEPGKPSIYKRVVEIDCLNNCSQHGACDNGTCICETGYIAVDCSTRAADPPVLTELEYEGLCDVKNQTCDDMAVFGTTFVENPGSKCRRYSIKMSEAGAVTNLDSTPTILDATIDSISEAVCPLDVYDTPDPIPVQQQTFSGYKLSVANDGQHYSNQLIMIYYNSDCVTCTNTNNTITCQISKNHCLVNDRCYSHDESYVSNDKYICQVDENGGRWELNDTSLEGPCGNYTSFTYPASRLTTNMLSAGSVRINDRYLSDGWYGKPGRAIPSVTAPLQYYCGTVFPIYLQTAPVTTVDGIQNIKACVRRYSVLCKYTIDVKVQYCGNNFFVYYLVNSPLESSGYCLE
ncbi:von Willebrand factor D and EGF domain-containing protein-like [Patella vulgata]|uniref:von Willebrand factor D and EGF domain-containing protein-like n=1 Tax=Patella vulgata TaxID=6465 RepID=UPI0024A7F940|nr:von Willebrand factor D and EGF domain-containing protein-like [Patella vulgata]